MFRGTKTVLITEKEREIWHYLCVEDNRGLVPNLSNPITFSFSDRRGKTCVVCHSGAGRLGTLKYNSFRWRSIRMLNRLPKSIPMLSSCSVVGFKSKFDSYLKNIVDLPCRPGFNNSLDGGDCLHGGYY